MRDSFGEVVEKLRRSTVLVKAHRHATGSGVIWSTDGQLVTNAHVVEGAGNSHTVEVELWDGRRLPGRVTQRDPRADLAALRIEASGLPAVAPGDSHALCVGELVIAVGNPLGFTGAASTGVVHRSTRQSWVISQLRLAPGNSGGPLANARGQVIGINTMVSGGLAFAIPAHSVVEFLGASLQSPGELGVVVRPVSLERAALGFILLEVLPNSPADIASLRQGDILVGVDGQPFGSIESLGAALSANGQGVLRLQFRRGVSPNLRMAAVRFISPSVRAA